MLAIAAFSTARAAKIKGTTQMKLQSTCQHITNPAYNASRGPIRVTGARLHLEY